MFRKIILTIFSITHLIHFVLSHGRLLVPPARSSAWREDPIRFPAYYDDNQMFCGGADVQWRENDGACGICGDNFKGPRLFEKGGTMYRGHIVRNYTQGQIIDVTIQITANHLGYFEFRLCNIDNINQTSSDDATQECLDRTLLSNSRGITKIAIGKLEGTLRMRLVLPQNFTCNHCVFQWKYNTQNSWGRERISGKTCVGCGEQEQFYGCADISILR